MDKKPPEPEKEDSPLPVKEEIPVIVEEPVPQKVIEPIHEVPDDEENSKDWFNADEID